MAERNIVALGGGGFSEDDTSLDDFILGLTGKDWARVCFLPTATGDSDRYVALFHDAFPPERAAATHLKLFGAPREDIRDFLLGQDVIYVGGGNTANMLAVWRVHGVDEVMRDAWEAGIVLCGISAGMICWFEASVTDSFGPLAPLHDGLGLLPGSACPHYDGEVERRPTYTRLVAEGFPGGYAAEDGVALHFRGTELAEAVSARPDGLAYRVEPDGKGGFVETPLAARFLG